MKGKIVEGSKGKYAVLSEAGEGGVGTVFKAKNVSTGEIVALKVLHSKRFELTDVQRERFRNEICASLEISSQFVVRGLDSGEYQGQLFLVMEWLDGGTLQELIDSGKYDSCDVIAFASQLIKAFQDLERLGLIHRDIKPNNVLLGADRRLKLSDLGLLRSISAPAHLTASDAQIGSLLYISERQRFAPNDVTSRDDFFALCLILYELASKRRIHNRNVPLAYLHPAACPSAFCKLIDLGMQDLDSWRDTLDEICSYLDLEKEQINAEYAGSVIAPEYVVQKKIEVMHERAAKRFLSKEKIAGSDIDVDFAQLVVNQIVTAFDECVAEFLHCGVGVGIANSLSEDSALYFSAYFTGELEIFLEETELAEKVNDRLFGWLSIEHSEDDSLVIDGVGGKRLFIDYSYFSDDDFKRKIVTLDGDTKVFLRHVGRALALGAALGAIERIEDFLEDDEE